MQVCKNMAKMAPLVWNLAVLVPRYVKLENLHSRSFGYRNLACLTLVINFGHLAEPTPKVSENYKSGPCGYIKQTDPLFLLKTHSNKSIIPSPAKAQKPTPYLTQVNKTSQTLPFLPPSHQNHTTSTAPLPPLVFTPNLATNSATPPSHVPSSKC